MFWLAVIGGGLFLLHVIVRLTLKVKRNKSDKQKDSGALIMPRFEIFLMFLALPCLCQASVTIIKGKYHNQFALSKNIECPHKTSN